MIKVSSGGTRKPGTVHRLRCRSGEEEDRTEGAPARPRRIHLGSTHLCARVSDPVSFLSLSGQRQQHARARSWTREFSRFSTLASFSEEGFRSLDLGSRETLWSPRPSRLRRSPIMECNRFEVAADVKTRKQICVRSFRLAHYRLRGTGVGPANF